MISIKVGNKPLYVPKDTTLVLEQSNNVFSDDGIVSDIIWSFEIPAKPNQATLGAVQYMYYCGSRRYDCEVAVDGVLILSGYLYVQSSRDESRLTCGIVANPFGTGFGDRKLRENNYGSPVVISETEDGHRTGWRQFLLGSLSPNSVYKFFPFVDSKFYKDNEDYGMFNGTESPLANSYIKDKGYTISYVNRLFYTQTTRDVPQLVEDGDSSKRGCRLFNKASTTAQNGYCFAPALRLDWLVKKVFAAAGLSVSGSFFQAKEIKRLYVQSLCAMDGSSIQYGARNSLTITGTQDSHIEQGSMQNFVSAETGDIANVFRHTSYHSHKFNFSFELDQSTLVRNAPYTEEENFELYDEIYAIAILPKDGGTLPTWRMKVKQYGGDDSTYDPFIYGHLKTMAELKTSMYLDENDTISSVYKVDNGCAYFNYTHDNGVFSRNKTSNDIPINHSDSILIQITPSKSRPKNNLSEGYIRGELSMFADAANVMCCHYNWNRTLPDGQYVVKLVKVKVATSNTDISVRWSGYFSLMNVHLSAYGQMEKLIYDEEEIASVPIVKTDPTLNIFSRILDWGQHVPNLTNSEFIDTLCKAFGLSFFVNPITRQAQLNFFNDTMRGDCIDVSQWITSKERLEYSPKNYDVAFSPLLGEEKTVEGNILEPVALKGENPSALLNQNKHVFVLNEGAFRQADVDEEENEYSWPQTAGDSRPLSAGAKNADENEVVTIEVNTPNMTYADEEVSAVEEKYLCQIESEGCSPMLDKEYTGEFPFILQQYNGRRQIKAGDGEVYIEDANPTIYDRQGHENASAISISTVGKRSIGELWLKSVYDFLGNCDRYRLTAHMPSWIFCKMMDTLRPQGGGIVSQIRWLYCNGQRFLPTKISSEISERNKIIATIECAAPHIEV